jgi:hypothetical protein
MLSVYSSSKCSLFHNSNLFGSCIIHILYRECAKIKKNKSGAKRLSYITKGVLVITAVYEIWIPDDSENKDYRLLKCDVV